MPATPNSSWARSHGSCERGGGSTSGGMPALGLVGLQAAALNAMRDEVVGITPTPGGLRPRAASDLTARCRTRTLATADAVVRHKPPTADTAGPLREHPQMLASPAGRQRWSTFAEQTWVNSRER